MYNIMRISISVMPIIMGASLLLASLSDLMNNSAATDWPVATGTITETTVNRGLIFTGESYLSYRYNVDGREYTGHRISFGGGSAADYRQGQELSVYYNPSNFSEAVLEPGFKRGNLFMLLVGIALILVGKQLWTRLK